MTLGADHPRLKDSRRSIDAPSRMREQKRFQHPGTVIALALVLAVAQVERAQASGNGQSSSGSSNSSDSSKGSGDSSNSTQNSPKNSSDWTTKNSSDWTTHSHGAHMFSIALLVVGVGATVLGVVLTDRSHRGPPPAAALAGFMRRQHALLLHDVSTAEGPVLDAWAHDLRLTPVERNRLRSSLEGSAEQGLLIDALDGTIDESHAQQFGAAFLRVTGRALGRTRTKALVARAMAAGHGG
jgi:hypothetical protein